MKIGPQERAAYEALVLEAFGNGGTTGEKGKRYRILLECAEDAGHRWAGEKLEQAYTHGLIAQGKTEFQRLNLTPVSYEGKVSAMSTALSVKRKDEDGRTFFEPKQLAFWTWQDVRSKIAEALRNTEGLAVTITGLGRLLVLREQFPDSVGPAEACRLAGTTIEEVVYGEEEAV